MKILYLAHKNPVAEDEGAKIVVMGTLRQLAAMGHEVTLLMLDATLDGQAQLLPLCDSVRAIHHRFPTKGILLIHSLATGVPLSVLLYRNAGFAQAVADALASRRFDLVHVETALLYDYARNSRQVPIVVRHHNLEGDLLMQQSQSASVGLCRMVFGWQARILIEYEREVISRAALSLAITEVDRSKLAAAFGGAPPRVEVVPSGVDALDVPVEQGIEHCLVFSGRMEWLPNREGAMWFSRHVFPRLREKFPNLTWYIVGGNPSRETRELAGEGVVVTGFVKSVVEYIDRAEVVVVPLLAGSGMRLKILEAMARGKAVVSTRKGVEGIECHSGQDILIADSPQAFAGAVESLLDAPTRRQALGAKALRTVKARYSWDSVGNQLVECYERAIGGCGSSVRGEPL